MATTKKAGSKKTAPAKRVLKAKKPWEEGTTIQVEGQMVNTADAQKWGLDLMSRVFKKDKSISWEKLQEMGLKALLTHCKKNKIYS